MIRTWRWLPMAILAVLLMMVFGCQTTAERSASGTPDLPVAPVQGAYAPDLALRDLNGDEVTLSGLRGKAVLLNFWATW